VTRGNVRLRVRISAPAKLLWLLAALLLAGEAAGVAAQFHRDLPVFIAVALLQGVAWAAAAIVVTRGFDARSLMILILGTAALLRMIALAAPVFLSDDINRYIWDGRVQAAGINPYRYVPTDPELAPLRDEVVFPNINRNNYAPTIYPPVAQMLFLLANRFGQTAFAVKFFLVLVEAVGIWALLLVFRAIGAPREQILLYAWHPLPIWEIAGAGHIDGALVAFVALALLAHIRGRRAWSGVALAAATLVKFFPAVLAPALWRPAKSNRGDWRWLAAFIAAIIAAYAPYLGVGWRVLGFLPGYVAEENLASGSGFWLLDVARQAVPVPLPVYFALAAAVMAGLTIGARRRAVHPSSSLAWATVLATAALFFASPHYSWYFLWLVALLTVAPWWPAWWLTLAAPLLYCDAKTGHNPLWVGFTLYGGFAILCILEVARRSLRPGSFGARHGIDRTT
jgi:alpha-1,6-mannosyltransferase